MVNLLGEWVTMTNDCVYLTQKNGGLGGHCHSVYFAMKVQKVMQ